MSRRVARELALRALFMVAQGRAEPSTAIAQAAASLPRARSANPQFVDQLVTGTLGAVEEIDQAVQPHLHGWGSAQMPVVDRTVLRLAAYELLYTGEPVGAVVSEAVALARQYSTPDSGRYVNGVLGALARSRSQPADNRSAAAVTLEDSPEPQ